MSKLNILFLDIDGVIWTVPGVIYHRLNSGEERRPSKELDPTRLALLDRMCEKVPNLRIVISSTWRLSSTLDELRGYFGERIGKRIIGKTPKLPGKERGSEIKLWFDLVKDEDPVFYESIDTWAILDDDSDMFPMLKGFFQTDTWDGLSYRTMEKVISYFNGNKTHRRKVHIENTRRWIKKSAFYWLVKKPLRYGIYYPLIYHPYQKLKYKLTKKV